MSVLCPAGIFADDTDAESRPSRTDAAGGPGGDRDASGPCHFSTMSEPKSEQV